LNAVLLKFYLKNSPGEIRMFATSEFAIRLRDSAYSIILHFYAAAWTRLSGAFPWRSLCPPHPTALPIAIASVDFKTPKSGKFYSAQVWVALFLNIAQAKFCF